MEGQRHVTHGGKSSDDDVAHRAAAAISANDSSGHSGWRSEPQRAIARSSVTPHEHSLLCSSVGDFLCAGNGIPLENATPEIEATAQRIRILPGSALER